MEEEELEGLLENEPLLTEEEADERLIEEEQAKLASGLSDVNFSARVFKSRMKRNKDALVLITGERGEGKTTLAYNLASAVDPRFEFERNMLFNPTVEQLHEVIYALPKYSAIIVDEAVRTSYRRNWQTSRNKILNEMLALCRYQNKAIFFCIPERSMVDNDLYKQVLFWIHVAGTGVAVVLRKSRNPFSNDPWNLKVNNKLMETYLKRVPVFDLNAFLKAMSRSPNYLMQLSFDRMPKEIEDEYTALRPKFELRQSEPAKLKVTEERREAALKKMILLMLQSGKKQSHIIRETGCPQNLVYDVARNNNLRPTDIKLGRKPPKNFGEVKDEELF